MTRKRRRLMVVIAGLSCLGVATALVLNAFEDNLVFFFGPSEVAAREVAPGQRIRVGGLVVAGSVERMAGSEIVDFRISDGVESIPVRYDGMLPDLFREGQGIVAEGRLDGGGLFVADTVLAKHDETYMPPEVAEALKRSGHWEEGQPMPAPELVREARESLETVTQ